MLPSKISLVSRIIKREQDLLLFEHVRLNSIKDIPAQWAKTRQGLDIFRISSECVCLSNGEVYENLTVPFLRN